MTVNIIAYPPGGGGNHLRNIVSLDERFRDQWPWPWVIEQSVGLAPYDHPTGVPGEVHSLPGRNMHAVFTEHITQNPLGEYLLLGHFGELAPYAAAIRAWHHVQWLLITIDQAIDRELLRSRQQRLQYHPYWLDEEQIWLYRTEMYTQYFDADAAHIYTVPLHLLWQENIQSVLDHIEAWFDLDIDRPQADILHRKWRHLNFGSGPVA